MIVFVLGLPGSGKSYFAERLAKKMNAEYVSSDRLRKELFAERTYSKTEKARVYREMLQRMESAIAHKKSIVLDATFHKKETRDVFLEKAEKQVFLIEIQASKALVRERLKKSRPYSEADFEVYELIRGQWDALERPHLILQSTDDNIDEMLTKALEYLSNDTGTDR
jgi:predicted kinase